MIFLRGCASDERRANNMSNAKFYIVLTIIHAIAGVAIWLLFIDGRFLASAVVGSVVTLFWCIISILGYIREDKIIRKIEEELKR